MTERDEMSQAHEDKLERINLRTAVITILVILVLFAAGIVGVLLVT